MDGKWTDLGIQESKSSSDSDSDSPHSKKSKKHQNLEEAKSKPKENQENSSIEEDLSKIAQIITEFMHKRKPNEIRQELKNSKLLEKINALNMAFLITQCNLIPRMCMMIFNENSKKSEENPLKFIPFKEQIKKCLENEKAFTALFKAWGATIQDLSKVAASIYESMSDKKNGHKNMLGIICAMAQIYTAYTPGAILEKVLGISIVNYAVFTKMNNTQIAKSVDIIITKFKELDFPSIFTAEKYQLNRIQYFDDLVAFYSGIFSVFSVKQNAEIFGMLFSAPNSEIKDENDIIFHKGMEAFFLKKFFDSLHYSTAQSAEFIEIWDYSQHLRFFLQKIEKLHIYGFDYDNSTKTIVRTSEGMKENNLENSRLSKYLS